MVSLFGAALIVGALLTTVGQIWVSVLQRERNRVFVGDPWNGRTLEWSMSAPPPEYNFAIIPTVTDRDAFMAAKEDGTAYQPAEHYQAIEVTANTSMGMSFCIAATLLGFGLVWHIWWLALLALISVPVTFLWHSFKPVGDRVIPAEDVEREHKAWLAAVAAAEPIMRDAETASSNTGLAAMETAEAVS